MTPAIVARAANHASRTAIVDGTGRYTYDQLLAASARTANGVLAAATQGPVAYMGSPGFHRVATQWGIWRAGRMAVPLVGSHADAELAYVLSDSGAGLVVADHANAERAQAAAGRLGVPFLAIEALHAHPEAAYFPEVHTSAPALLFYTSGTTSRPKGVVLTHANVEAQVGTLVEAWAWQPADHILNVLPLHHVHGVVNVVACALWSGATLEFQPKFDADAAWQRFMEGGLTLFMGVPTMYARLIAVYDAATPGLQRRMREACRGFRLMVSGSAALPVSVLSRWEEISGHVLLERYGMTETGMILSNPLVGERRPGFVGGPLPGVEVRLTDEQGASVPDGTPGEVEVRGANVFREYLGQPEATREAFRDGWFRTGDVGVLEQGSYRLLGRLSVDIIKCGGYKLSALEIEEVLRDHPAIAECAVVGVPDTEYGERVGAVVALHEGRALTLGGLQDWARDRLAGYKLPTRLVVVDLLPRNAMGKVVKGGLWDQVSELSQE